MKIEYKKGDALNGTEKHLAHGCNNQGVMGSGIAKQIRAQYEPAYDYYRWNHTRQGLQLGKVYEFECNGKLIFNCVTQDGYGRDGEKYVRYDAIAACMLEICYWFNTHEIKSITPRVAMPMIGAGLGGGDWTKIVEVIELNSNNFRPIVYQL
jgi:O-acetyl-ADP-ribose deacetylase (regulator of RNase III)